MGPSNIPRTSITSSMMLIFGCIGPLDLSQIAINIMAGQFPPGDEWNVRIISEARLRRFWEPRTRDRAIAQRDLATWRKLTKAARCGNFAELRQTFGSADLIGDCVVFDVGNNRYRLIGRVRYATGIVYVLKVMDHTEYDQGR